ncbi:GDP-fucose protein O-fucosyltransferase-domain-containing protein [Mortierella sp. GBAus27b]|nr:hypothetical protein BGX31_011033 [Mortierella sp. GBA43]KAI8355993.1 GDP-fucose protein O-fucosyltransferase-domain-containing protein [Mortierella sp. GBAus27b]
MASPKIRPAVLPRFAPSATSTTSRTYSVRQLILLLSFVLLMTSGAMLIFYVISITLSSGRNSNAAGCTKDAEFAIIRWRPSNGDSYTKGNDIYSNKDSSGTNADDKSGQWQQSPQQPLVRGNQDLNTGGGSDEAARQEGEAMPEQTGPFTPFEETLDQKDDVQYVTYLPYAGITNQFYGMLRGMEVAKALGRTLIIPPITASSHDKSKQNQPWSTFLDLDKFQELTGTKIVEFHKLRDVEKAEYNQLECKITCGFGSKRTIDFTAKGFLKQFKLNVTLTPLSLDANKLDTVTKILGPFKQEKFVCISNTYKISTPDKSEWDRFGQHLHFTPGLENFVTDYLDRHLVRPEPVYDSNLGREVVPTQKYIAIHIRRGDFAQYCQSNFAGPKMVHCLPSTEEIASRVDKIQAKYNPSGSPNNIMPVFVATNENRPEELKKFADLGWTYLDHNTMGTAEALGVFGPMMVDQVFMAHAQALIGIQMSTFSRVGALRQRDWHKRQIDYM